MRSKKCLYLISEKAARFGSSVDKKVSRKGKRCLFGPKKKPYCFVTDRTPLELYEDYIRSDIVFE